MVFIKEKPHEILQTAGLDVEISGGLDERGKFRGRDIAQGALERTPAAFRRWMAFSTLPQLVFWVRMAPTITSNRVCAGHQYCGPNSWNNFA